MNCLSLLVSLALATPVTVLEHTVDVSARSSGPRYAQTWVVRIDAPQAALAGVETPPGLDGLQDRGGAVIDGGFLLIPPSTEAGTVLTFASRLREDWTGWVHQAPGVPTERLEVVVDHQSGPLEVWLGGAPGRQVRRSGSRSTATFTWTGLEGDENAAMAWSTWGDWPELGDEVQRTVLGKVANRDGLGQDLAWSISSMSPTEAWARMDQFVAYERSWPEGWDAARPVGEVLKSGEGSAAERGLVLMSLLMVAQIRCEAGGGREAVHAPPAWLTLPQSVSHPMVAAHWGDEWVWLDPLRAPAAAQAHWAGRTVWRAGALPEERPSGASEDVVHVSGTWSVVDENIARFSASVSANQTAAIWLRERLGPLDEAGRAEVFTRLLAQGHGQAMSVSVSGDAMTGDGPLRISLQGRITRGHSLVPPLLAPALLGWLPAHTSVSEDLRLTPPPSQPLLGQDGGGPRWGDDAWVVTELAVEGDRLVLSTRGERVSDLPGSDATVASWSAEAARRGVELFLGNTRNTPVERAVEAALAELPASRQKKAWSAVDWDEAAAMLDRFAGNGRVWKVPLQLAETDAQRLLAARRVLVDPSVDSATLKKASGIISELASAADARTRGLALYTLAQEPEATEPGPAELLTLAWEALQPYPEDLAQVALLARTLAPELAPAWLAASAPTPEVVAAELPGLAADGAPTRWVEAEASAALQHSREVGALDDAAEALLLAEVPEKARAVALAAHLLAPSKARQARLDAAEALLAAQLPPPWPSPDLEPQTALATGWTWLADGERDRSALLARRLLRDGRVPESEALWWGATAGRVWRPDQERRLDQLRKHPRGAEVDFELRLLAGTWEGARDPHAERAQTLLGLGTTTEPKPGPAGWKASPLLTVAGASAWSSPSGVAVQLIAPATSDGALPEPLPALYQPDGRPLDGRIDGARLFWLTGGALPLYAAVRTEDGQSRVGLAATPALAWDALDAR